MAMDREMEREEMRKLESEEQRIADEEAEQRRQQKREEALARRKAREEKQAKQREAEEENWEKAMSGELTGRRKAAIVSAKNVSTVNAFADTVLVEERNELTTAMYKSELACREVLCVCVTASTFVCTVYNYVEHPILYTLSVNLVF